MARISLPSQVLEPDAARITEFSQGENVSSHLLHEGQSGSTDMVKQGTSARAADSKALASAGILGELQLTSIGDQLVGSGKDDQKLIDDYNALSKKTGGAELTSAEKFALRTLPGPEGNVSPAARLPD